ncbi:sugar transferase [Clostridium perfringens]|uniref:sugar transferase n=1 Tax=Clostridium perfringens TaxID=1502 RepID=UPI0018E4CC94|nr:sugar transferase [Clostridium perfringens]ELC8413683.1 sugar transferase [Clostridium perfringens]MBI6007234.1 sugar transferase [Clostridium perfringens]MDM0605563.1 sugar transferase [Clostridium perfringens]MDM0638777.1 sugar transferase [Clostridium perfringens]HAT4166201.1 sugar transferase [Clostridium perfringens]
MLKCWDDLPKNMQTEAVRPYYDILKKRKISLLFKRVFDIIVSIIMLVILSPIIIILSIAIVLDSKGGVFFRQERITQYGRKFYIHKFRTMVANAENLGSQVTVSNDVRVTKIGAKIRKYRLDELPQLIDILQGNMSFVGTRPEVTKYVEKYTPEMLATLLLPAGITSEASIKYKDEERLLQDAENVDEIYINKVLPEKMKYNLRSLDKFNFFSELGIMIKTVLVVIK